MRITLLAMLVISKLLLFLSQNSLAIDTITLSESLHDGSTLVSNGGTFELGFFSRGSSTKRYVGIWYKNIPVQTVVWVANRDHPINDNSSVLSIIEDGNLVLLSQNRTLLWSTNVTTKALSPIVQLLNTGNLVLRDQNNYNNEDNFLWQSFDHPCDTLLPGMKLGWNLKTGLNRRLTAWKDWEDPSPGDFTSGIELGSNPQAVTRKGLDIYTRGGPWNGVTFSGIPALRANPLFDYTFVNKNEELYYSYSLKNKSVISIFVLNQTLYRRQRITWIPELNQWKVYQFMPQDQCDGYNLCGAYGDCVFDASPVCQCLEGFNPKSPQNWSAMDWTQGCEHNEPWSCRVKNKDGFRRIPWMKLPDTTYSWVNRSMTLGDCKAKCFENCSCTAYANLDVRGGGSGCVIWFGDLIDLRQIPEAGQDLYVRMAVSETVNVDAKDGHKKKVAMVASITLLSGIALLFTFSYIYRARRNCGGKKDEGRQPDFELPFFDLATIIHATNCFSVDKKLGEGGFGPVYKGTLENGQEVAVKRLSRSSRQGLKEFKNEVVLCVKLQHRNLVKVIGCCIEEKEKLLLYEYMPNKSLDSLIESLIYLTFYVIRRLIYIMETLIDSTQSKRLDWSKRSNIINGIARGLLYLHQDSRLRIIHRDLKASNVLLDNEMNPKISDFGLARMCGSDQVEGSTNRVVGTYGYMAPEYAIEGLFSIKSDVFSFGILLLEIISGKRNRGHSFPSNKRNLIGHAWRLWKEGISTNLIDTCFRDSCILSEVFRYIHIGLLCVQQRFDDRPNMACVVVMLSSEIELPQPKEPGFLLEMVTVKEESSLNNIFSSNNEVTMSILDAR